MKQGQTIGVSQRPTSNANLLVYDRVDNRRAWQYRQKLPCASSRDKFLGQSFVLGSSALGSEKYIVDGSLSIPVAFNTYQFKLYSDKNTARAWEIYDMKVNQTLLAFGCAEAQR